ncbi:MAG: flagellar hook-associated protein FlgL [Pseudomonadota bacterium]
MVDRISTIQIFQQGVTAILARQAEVSRTQQQLATGERISSPSDDPAGAVQILDIEEDLRQIDQFQRNAVQAEQQLALSDTTLGEVSSVIQRVRELTIQANNATQSAADRSLISSEIQARLEELVALANTRDASGEYIFAGFQAETQPFSRSGNTVSYAGDDGQRFLRIAAGTQVAVRDTGSRVFLSVPSGNGEFDFSVDGNLGTATVGTISSNGAFVRDDYTITFIQALPTDPITYEVRDSAAALVSGGTYEAGATIDFAGASVTVTGEPADGDTIDIDATPNQSLFETVGEIVAALNQSVDTAASDAEVNTGLSSALINLDQALGNVAAVRSEVGARLNRIDSQQEINADFNLQLETTLTNVRDLDYTEAISRLNAQLLALQAAQQTYVQTQGLSLFNFI